MTDLMKRYEIEMNWTLEQAKKDYKVGLFLSAYREWLEAQLTWRDVSEMDDKGSINSLFITIDIEGQIHFKTRGQILEGDGFYVKWLPIPKETICGQS